MRLLRIMPGTHVVVQALLPRGGSFEGPERWVWPNRFTKSLGIINDHMQVRHTLFPPGVPAAMGGKVSVVVTLLTGCLFDLSVRQTFYPITFCSTCICFICLFNLSVRQTFYRITFCVTCICLFCTQNHHRYWLRNISHHGQVWYFLSFYVVAKPPLMCARMSSWGWQTPLQNHLPICMCNMQGWRLKSGGSGFSKSMFLPLFLLLFSCLNPSYCMQKLF